jgi:hypothetical protein
MYQTDFLCTYKLMDNADDQEDLYRIQLLQAFDLTVWDDTEINNIMMDVFHTMNKSREFKQIIQKSYTNVYIKQLLDLFVLQDTASIDSASPDSASLDPASLDPASLDSASLDPPKQNKNDDLIFTLLFKYEYFDLLHRCICDYAANGVMSETILNTFLNAL